MPKGGHARSGPAPDPNALRRSKDAKDWLDLPSTGRAGDAPVWPLSRPSKRELELWEAQWRRPQAVAWEMLGQELEVALFVRATRIAEGPSASAADRTVVLRLMDGLGLTVGGLARNRWRIVDESGEAAVSSRPAADVVPLKDRLKAVSDG